MANKVKKGFLYYLLWLVFIVFGVTCIFACVLIFNNGKDVFGIGIAYVSDRGTATYNYFEVDGTRKDFGDQTLGIKNVEFVSDYANFQIARGAQYEKTTFIFDKKTTGFVKDSKNNDIALNFSLDGDTLRVEVIAPKYWLSLSKSINVKMFCPAGSTFENYNFICKTTSGGIHFAYGESRDISIKSLDVETQSGEIFLDDRLTIASGTANILSKTSKIYVYSDITQNLNIETQSSKILVDDISGNLNIEADTLNAKCNNIGGNVKSTSKSGYIFIDKIGSLLSGGNFTADFDVMKITNVTIGTMSGTITIPDAGASNIKVDKVGGEAYIKTKSGNVTIGQIFKTTDIETESGKVNITQTGETHATKIKTKSGSVTANFTKVYEAEIETTKGSITINVATNEAFKFNYKTSGKVTISWETVEIGNEGTWVVANSNTTHEITATSQKGNIHLNNGFDLEEN